MKIDFTKWRKRASLFAALHVLLSHAKAFASDQFKKFRFDAHALNQENALLPTRLFLTSPDSQVRDIQRDFGNLLSGAEKVRRVEQKIGGATVKGTWLTEVFSSSGKVVYRAGEILENPSENLKSRVDIAWSQRSALVEKSKDILKASGGFKEIYSPELEIQKGSSGEPRLEWILNAVSADETQLLKLRFSETSELLAFTKSGGHNFVDGSGVVYPQSHNKSTLSQVSIEQLDGSGLLSGSRVKVSTAINQKAEAPNYVYNYPTEDLRFDQVQTYFFAHKALHWFKSSFDAEPLYRLEVKVQVGENSNAAFYFGGRVRLGSGDNVKFGKMLRDPSIVSHEIGHAIVEKYAGLPADGEGGSLNEAFSDFFAASLLQNPNMGDGAYLLAPYVRTLKNDSTVQKDLQGGLYQASLVVSGSLWDLREAFGPQKGELLAFRTLSRLGPTAKFVDFVPALKAAAETLLDAHEIAVLEDVIKRRGRL